MPCLSVGSNFLLILRCFFFKCLQIQSDYEIEKSHEPDHKDAVVRINIFNKDHRQTIQYIDPSEATRVANAELGLSSLVLVLPPLPFHFALFFNTDIDGPTPHIIAYFNSVCSFVDPANPRLIGKSIFSVSNISNHFITG